MFSVDELVGTEFKGFFRRDFPEGDDPDKVINRKYDFLMKMLDYDANSGLFIARGNDFWGPSGIVGQINPERAIITFSKLYTGRVSDPDLAPFPLVLYQGEIMKPDSTITLGGSYMPPEVENYKGTWRLDSCSTKS